jgi:GNAT superfamily N-acetyltransferase
VSVSVPSLEEMAEAALAFIPALPGDAVLHERRFLLHDSALTGNPLFGQVLRVRLAGEKVESAVADARAWFAARGRRRFSWWLREAANPPGLVERLLALGPVVDEADPVMRMMVLTEEPRAPGLDVRRVGSVEEALQAAEISIAAFAVEDRDAEALRASVRRRWQKPRSADTVTFLVFLEGEPVTQGTIAFSENGIGALFAGATLPRARGRGCFRALVAARYAEARRRGGAGVVVQAGAMSAPILEQLGFRTIDTLTVLLDHA